VQGQVRGSMTRAGAAVALLRLRLDFLARCRGES
jgi:hypothetical protein